MNLDRYHWQRPRRPRREDYWNDFLWWHTSPISNVSIGGGEDRHGQLVWKIANSTGIPMIWIHVMERIMLFGHKGFNVEWSPCQELEEIRKRAPEDASLLALGDALPFEELVEIWLRCREGLRLAVTLGDASHEDREAYHRGERGASVLQMKARELLKKREAEG
jgi:hypothetical protein